MVLEKAVVGVLNLRMSLKYNFLLWSKTFLSF